MSRQKFKYDNYHVSNLSFLHKEYNKFSSNRLHNLFQNDPFLWHNYHRILRYNYKLMSKSSLPHNIIIKELTLLSNKGSQTVVDMGCGDALISQHFARQKHNNLYFINYDHMAVEKNPKAHIIIVDISDLPIHDCTVNVTIICMSMWGTNYESYIREAYRVLKPNGILLIIEPTYRWSHLNTFHKIINGSEGMYLKDLLQKNGFEIIKEEINAYCFFTCIR